MRKTLFTDDYEAMTQMADEIAEKLEGFFRPLLLEYMEAGYVGREVELIALNSIMQVSAEEILKKATKLRRSKLAAVSSSLMPPPTADDNRWLCTCSLQKVFCRGQENLGPGWRCLDEYDRTCGRC